jgi:hypothetical protein
MPHSAPSRVTGGRESAKWQKTDREGNARMADNKHETEHKHGSMDISVQEKTFAGFIRMSMWGAGISIGILIFLALTNS